MSLIAPLLSLPGRVRKLRSYNAVKLPATESIAPVVTKSYNMSFAGHEQYNSNAQISREQQEHETHFAILEAQYKAVELRETACDITGRGALYGVWMVCSGVYDNGINFQRVGASIVLDGVELIDSTWEFDTRNILGGLTGQTNSFRDESAFKIPFLGTLKSTYYRWYGSSLTDNVFLKSFTKEYVPLLKPLRFDQSLKIELVHEESELLYSYQQTARLCAAIYEDA